LLADEFADLAPARDSSSRPSSSSTGCSRDESFRHGPVKCSLAGHGHDACDSSTSVGDHYFVAIFHLGQV